MSADPSVSPSTLSSHGDPSALEPLPAQVATRITLLLAVSGSAAATLLGSVEKPGVLAVLWGLALGLVVTGWSRRVPERAQQVYLAGSWFAVGHAVLYEGGLRGGPLALLVSLGLFGLFFGTRVALGGMIVTLGSLALAGAAEVRGWWRPQHPTQGDVVEAWAIHLVMFGVMATMLTLTQAATLARAARAANRARHFALAAEHSDRAVFVLDARGAVAWVNDAFTRTTGYTQREAVGRTLPRLLAGPATDPAALARLEPATAPPRAQAVELVVHPRGGEPLWASVELRPLLDAAGSSGLLLDVTEAHAQAELEQLQRVLSLALSGARSVEEADAALVQALIRSGAVLGARLHRWREGRPALAAQAVSPDRRHPERAILAALEAVPSAPPPGEEVSVERVEEGPAPHHRARLGLGGPSSGWLEVLFSTDAPGRAALLSRIPSLVDQLARHERRLADQARFEALFDRSPDALVLLDPEGRPARHNALAGGLWPALAGGSDPGWPSELGRSASVLLAPGAGEAVLAVAWQHAGEGSEPRDLEASVAPMPLPEGRGVLVSVRDVTARRAAERALEAALAEVRAALAEREVLIQEIHHRVKNNLQIVSSLLAMQADRTGSDEARLTLRESVLRIRSLSLIHQTLYAGRDLARVDLADYARTLTLELCATLSPSAELEIEATPTDVEVERAIPCGLILNELVTNALKHGVDPDGRCAVRVEVGRREGNILLAVADRGPGLPPGVDLAALQRSSSLGMRLVTALTRQLGATVQLESGVGARFVLVMPEAPVRRSVPSGAGT